MPDPPTISAISDDSVDSFDNESSRSVHEEQRMRLREIELKTVRYQDELESGQRALKSGWTIQQQTEHYRRKLMKRIQRDSPQMMRTSSSLKRSPSPLEMTKMKKSKRSPSPAYSRSSRRKSRSPGYSKQSVSPVRSSRRERNRSDSQSRSRSQSLSPKRSTKNQYSTSPSRTSKYESPLRRYRQV